MERMTPDTDKREWLGEWIYAIFVQNYEKLLEKNKNLRAENKKLKEENEKLKSDLGNIQCEFWFECDECEYWKREIKKLRWLQICWKTVAERIEDERK